VILDDIHRLPRIFQSLRSLIDRRKRKGKRTGQFLLLGSASIDLLQQSAETLAGRIAYMELTPFLESEVIGFSPMPARLFGSVAASQTAFSRKPKFRASNGARPSSRPIWNGTFPR
jgi:predicted AAA+ superfamily ATPase